MSGDVNISDTARWVAVYRAEESARPDRLFDDPYAARLAGDFVHRMTPWMRRIAWPMIVRTRAIDDLVAASIAEGCDRVLNLAAGLDTRPYRLPLPATLRWIEADLPAMVAEKERRLAGETPRCALSRVSVDLADAAARGAFLDEALAGASRALVVTEGLLGYLDPDAVAAIARDLAKRDAVAWWITDLASPAIIRMMQKQTRAVLDGSARFKFGPKNGVAFFAPFGWNSRDVRSMFRDAYRFKRLPWFYRPLAMIFGDPPPDAPGEKRPWSAVVRLAR